MFLSRFAQIQGRSPIDRSGTVLGDTVPPLMPTRNESTAPFSHYTRARDQTSCVITVFSSKSFLLALHSPQWALGNQSVEKGSGLVVASKHPLWCPENALLFLMTWLQCTWLTNSSRQVNPRSECLSTICVFAFICVNCCLICGVIGHLMLEC